MRLDKILADQGFGTRKEVRTMIKRGLVRTESHTLTDPAYHPAPEEFPVLNVNGKYLRPYPYQYYIFHKPLGVLTALTGRPGEATVGDYLPPLQTARGLVPVGRLDRDSSGLLLCTNDGELNHRLCSPKREVPKRYYVELNPGLPPFDEGTAKSFARGVKLEDGPTKPAETEFREAFRGVVTLREGRHRQLRRMFEALGQEVLVLHRLSFGPLVLDETREEGVPVELIPEEIEALYAAVNLPSPRYFNGT